MNSGSALNASDLDALCAAVADTAGQRLQACGGRTKPALLSTAPDVTLVDVRPYAGIVTYDPSEFLMTAKAGTRVADVVDRLAAEGQYLPFDPMFVNAGSTLGGAVASGLSGASRMLFGGLRDFVMEVELIDGLGQRVRGGGKVVKNAAGFDIPKLMVGSYGRLGIITELTLKVFPRPAGYASLRIDCRHLDDALETSQRILAQPLPIAAVNLTPSSPQANAGHAYQLWVRVAGPLDSLPQVVSRVRQQTDGTSQLIDAEREAAVWTEQAQLVERPTAEHEAVVRVAIGPSQLAGFDQALRQLDQTVVSWVFVCGGAVAYLRVQESAAIPPLDQILQSCELPGAVLSGAEVLGGTVDTPWLGTRRWCHAANRIREALDPQGRFPAY